MKTKEVKNMIIENFINYYITNNVEREVIKDAIDNYVEEDHVDEIAQAFPILDKEKQIEEAKALLRESGYFTDNLWCVDDVSDKFKCDAETAQGILYNALTNEYIVEQIQTTIIDLATDEKLEEIEE